MVTKGIITSIDFNGNTCQVRIPLFETAGNDPITGTAIVSNTPGSYNGYKVGDVVLVAFEDGKMQNPVIVGKLYLGAAKEKQDPRGTINVETTTASKSASLPADAVLTANVDSNVPNTNTPFGSLASIANNLNSLNTDVNQLDRFTRNQFNSVITDVNDQGEQLRSEIKQTAENIENKVVHKHKDGSQDALGWDLDEKEWKINAQDTVNGVVKDINIVTIDRSGMSIAGDLKLSGYPKNTTVLYAQTDNDTEQPQLYEFTNLGTSADKTWYYGKYIKLEENKYVLVLKENFEYYEKQGQLALGATIAYSRKMASGWSTTVPERTDSKYIWQWTHTEIYSFDEVNNIWNEEDSDKVVCITGADGKDGYNTITVMLYKRSTDSISGKQIDVDLYYKFSNQKLYTDDTCTTEYTLPEGWYYTISGAGDSSNGDLYCIAAVAHSNTDSDSIPASEWAGPTLYVENGVSGTSVAQLTLYQRAASTPDNPTEDGTWTYSAADGSLTCDNKETKWKTSIPSEATPCYESHAAVLVTGLGTTTVTTWSEPAKFVENGADGKPGDSIYTISIDNDFDSVPADVNGNVSSGYSWESETKHNVRVYYGKEAQDFTIVDQNGTASSTGLCLKYKLTNVTLDLENITPKPGVSSKVATAWIKALSADTGNILYTLYVDGVETGITGKFSATKIKSPAPTYTISIDNDFATIPTSIVNNKIYRNASNKFVPAANGYSRKTITVAGTTKKLPGMKLSAVKTTTKLKDALLQKPAELITGTEKSYVEDITKHNVTVYCNDDVETITTDNFIVKLDSDGLDADMDTTQNYLVCELGGFDSTGARATDFPGMNPTVNDNVVTNYITALSALGDTSESKNVYIQYTYYVKGKPAATAKFEVTRHTGPTTYYLSSNVSTIKINKNVNPATITPDKVICTAYSLDTSTNTNTRFTNGTWKYKWDNGAWSPTTSTVSDLEISTAEVVTKGYKQLYIELYLDKQLWDRETIDVVADGENAVDYNILVDNGQIKRDPNDPKEDTSSITFSFYKWNGSTRSNFNGAHFNCSIDDAEPTSRQCDGGTNTFTVNADSNPAISSIKKRIKVELLDKQNGTVVESETIDVVVNGSNGLYITNTKQWYKLVAKTDSDPTKPTTDIVKSDENGNPTHTTDEGWSDIPLDAINDMNLWTSLESIFSDDIPSEPKKRHIEFSDPVKDAAYALAQGKTTNYYSPTEPIYNIKKGDCWFDTGYVNVGALKNKTDYLGKFVISTTGDILVEQDENDSTRYIPNAAGSTRLIKVTPENIDTLIKNKTIVVGTTEAFETGNLKQCSGFNEDTKKAIWEDIAGELVTNKLTANYINALDITAKKITVLKDNSKELNGSNPILFQADGTSNNSGVNIGGFTVDSNRLYAGTPGSGSGIELSSYLTGLIAYKSNNQRVASSYAVSKITVNKDITNLTVYIRSYAETDYDYTIISTPNAESRPEAHNSNYVEAHTMGKQNSGSALADYTKVEYHDLKQNNWIYVVYRKDANTNSGSDTGYFLIPETADVSISNVGDYYFVRDSAFDIKGASIKVGSNFSVDSTGAIKSTSGTIGNLSIANDGLAYKSSSTSFEIGQESSDPRMPKYAIYSSAQRIDDCIMGLKDTLFGENLWFEFKPDGYYTYISNNNTKATITGKIPYEHMKHICWLNSTAGSQAYTGDNAICPQINVFNAIVGNGSYQTYDLSADGINEIIGAQITEKRTTTKSDWDRQWFVVDETKTKITIYNNSTETKTFSVLVIAI